MSELVKKVKPFLDKLLENVISRKLLVWATATYLLAQSSMDSKDWVTISMVYIASQGVIDLAKVWKEYSPGSE